jgi:hypothetical protein
LKYCPLLLLLLLLLGLQASLAEQYANEKADLNSQTADVAVLAAELVAAESASAELAAAADAARSALQQQQAALQQEVRCGRFYWPVFMGLENRFGLLVAVYFTLSRVFILKAWYTCFGSSTGS